MIFLIIFIVSHCLGNFRVETLFSSVFFHHLTRKTPYSCIFHKVSEFTFELKSNLAIASTFGSWIKGSALTRCPLYRGFSVISQEVNFSKFSCFWTILRPSSLKNYFETFNSINSWCFWWLTKYRSVRGVEK